MNMLPGVVTRRIACGRCYFLNCGSNGSLTNTNGVRYSTRTIRTPLGLPPKNALGHSMGNDRNVLQPRWNIHHVRARRKDSGRRELWKVRNCPKYTPDRRGRRTTRDHLLGHKAYCGVQDGGSRQGWTHRGGVYHHGSVVRAPRGPTYRVCGAPHSIASPWITSSGVADRKSTRLN